MTSSRLPHPSSSSHPHRVLNTLSKSVHGRVRSLLPPTPPTAQGRRRVEGEGGLRMTEDLDREGTELRPSFVNKFRSEALGQSSSQAQAETVLGCQCGRHCSDNRCVLQTYLQHYFYLYHNSCQCCYYYQYNHYSSSNDHKTSSLIIRQQATILVLFLIINLLSADCSNIQFLHALTPVSPALISHTAF